MDLRLFNGFWPLFCVRILLTRDNFVKQATISTNILNGNGVLRGVDEGRDS